MDALAHQVRQLLALADAGQKSIRGADWVAQRPPLHRSTYARASELLVSAGSLKGASYVPSGASPQHFCAYILLIGMAWSIIRFGQPVGSDTLVVAVSRRVERAYQNAAGSALSLDEAVDMLVEQSGYGIFSFDACVLVAVRCGIGSFAEFHALVMEMMVEDRSLRRDLLRPMSPYWTAAEAK